MPSIAASSIAERLAQVQARIAEAARRSGRPASAVRLIAVSKTHPASSVAAACAAGQLEFGENRVQEALEKMPQSPPEAVWHLIGHLQSNKAKLVPGAFRMVHTVDSIKLAEALDRHAQAVGATVEVLLQANLTGEATKSGVQDAAALEPLLAAVLRCPALAARGLMTMPDPGYDERRTRAVFARLRELLARLRADCAAGPAFCDLSMGMSRDFEWAIEEGATLVRVGTAIFGGRD
jgi:pyridoxal phosphate enzyme (YggS family)